MFFQLLKGLKRSFQNFDVYIGSTIIGKCIHKKQALVIFGKHSVRVYPRFFKLKIVIHLQFLYF